MGVAVTRVVKFIRKGTGISRTDVEYADSTSNSVAPASGWTTNAPAWQNGHYIWQRVRFIYTDGTDGYSNPVCLSGGKGISKIEEYYLATSASSGVTTSTSGWTKAVQSVTATKKYLWNYEVVTYTDGTTTTTTPVIIGTYGDKGVGITSITEYYLATSASSGVTRSTSGWTTSIQTVTNTNKYLWNYEVVTYTDGTTQSTDPVIIGVYGDTGNGISSVTEYYLASSSSSGVTTSTTGWTTDPTATAATMTKTKKYLWNYEKITYTNGTSVNTTPAIIGRFGDTGNGITSITEYYLATSASSGVTRSTSGWTTSIQTVTNTNKYLWNYEVVTYTDGTTQSTDPVIIGVYGDQGPGVNPNILLRTIFDNGIAPVKEAWSANWSYVNIDGASDTVIGGRKSIRINASTLAYNIDFTQDVYGKVKANTWYTLSFNYFSTAQWRTYLWPNTDSYACIDTTEWYIDGERSTSVPINGQVLWPSNWQGNRHSITFKTKSSFPTAYFKIIFRAMAGGQVAICMPKLEEGKVATAYIAHEDDLKGEQSTTPGPRGYRGPALRGPQDWLQLEEGYQFYKGDEETTEPYEDFIVYNGYYYKCIKTHTKTATNYPGSTYDTSNHLWELTTKVGLVAANILFGEKGYFGSAIIFGDWLISTNGEIDGTLCENGATFQGITAYSLFNPNNPSGGDVTKFNSTSTYTMAAGDTTKNITTVTLEAGKVYKLVVTGKAGSSSGSYYVRLRNTSTGATYTPVMINGTSNVMRSGYFVPSTAGTYYLEFYDTSGLTGEISLVNLSRKDFSPRYALDLLTGATYQHDGLFTGFVRKRKTKITSSNISRYKRDDITTANVLDFNKCGSFVELSTGVTDTYLAFPLLNSYLAGKYTEAQKDDIRGFIGTTLLIYNKSGSTLNFTYKMLSAQTFTDTLANNSFVELLCELDSENGDEVVYWKEIKQGTIV